MKALRIVYDQDLSSSKQLLDKDKSATIHQRNLQILAHEISKSINNMSSENKLF